MAPTSAMGAAIAMPLAAKRCAPVLRTGNWLRVWQQGVSRGVGGGRLPPRKRFQWGRTGERAGLLVIACLV